MQNLNVTIFVGRTDGKMDYRVTTIQVDGPSLKWEDIMEDVYNQIDEIYPELSFEHLADYVDGYGIIKLSTEDGIAIHQSPTVSNPDTINGLIEHHTKFKAELASIRNRLS